MTAADDVLLPAPVIYRYVAAVSECLTEYLAKGKIAQGSILLMGAALGDLGDALTEAVRALLPEPLDTGAPDYAHLHAEWVARVAELEGIGISITRR